VGWPYEAHVSGIDETRLSGEEGPAYVQRLAQTKAVAVAKKVKRGVVLGADTVVVVDGDILGQPRDDEDARRMLKLLSGRWHEVLTGVALVRAGHESEALVDYERTRVRFAEMSADEIDWYIGTGESRGKAGAYGMQGKAALLIEEIEGDYFNIVGLPIRLVYELSLRI
jgi:septum formation protein